MEERGTPAYVAEFIGTFFLVLFICSIVTVNSAAGLGFTDFAVIGLVHAFVLAMLIYTLGGTSGAHFNPAVTIALAALKKIRALDGVIYILAQLAGAVAGALVCKLLFLDEGDVVNYGAATVSAKFAQGHALSGLLAEALGTFVLMWAIMGLAVNPRGESSFGGWIIGATLGFAVMTFAPVSGAGFNPARWFGPAIVSGTYDDAWVYIVGPIVAAVLAALLYNALIIKPAGARAPVDTLPG